METSKVKDKLVAGFAWEGIARIITQVATWVSTLWVARILSPDDYGIVGISGIYIGLLAIISDMGFGSGLVNRKEITEEDQDTIFWLSFLIGLGLYAVTYLGAPFIELFYAKVVEKPVDGLAQIIQVSGLIIVIGSIKTVSMALAMRELRYKYRAMLGMFGRLSNAVVCIVMALMGYGPWALVISVLVNHTIVTIGFLLIMKRMPALVMRLRQVYPIISYGTKLMASRIFEYFSMRSAVIVISVFLGQTAVGFYSFANQLAMIPLDKVGALFNSVAFPALSRLQEDEEGFKRVFMGMHKYLLMLSFPVLILMIMCAEPIIIVLLTEKWLPAKPILQILCAVNLLKISGMLIPHVLAALGKAGKVLIYEVISGLLLTIGFVVGAYWGGTEAHVALAWVFVYPVIYILLWWMLLSGLPIKPLEIWHSIKATVIASLVMVLLVYLVSFIATENDLFSLILLCGSAGLGYIAVYFLLFREEITNMKNGIRSLRSSK